MENKLVEDKFLEEKKPVNSEILEVEKTPVEILEEPKELIWQDPVLKGKFKIKVKVYVTKNNVSWVITDILDQVIYKKTGGMTTKRGYLKNSQKVSVKNFSELFNVIKELKADYIYYSFTHGFGNKKSVSTMKSVTQIVEGFKNTFTNQCPVLINKTSRRISTIRLQGGRRGRR